MYMYLQLIEIDVKHYVQNNYPFLYPNGSGWNRAHEWTLRKNKYFDFIERLYLKALSVLASWDISSGTSKWSYCRYISITKYNLIPVHI